jgi:hypothetical protein
LAKIVQDMIFKRFNKYPRYKSSWGRFVPGVKRTQGKVKILQDYVLWEFIEADITKEKAGVIDEEDPVPKITKRHFEEAMKCAHAGLRHDNDIRKYKMISARQCSRSAASDPTSVFPTWRRQC